MSGALSPCLRRCAEYPAAARIRRWSAVHHALERLNAGIRHAQPAVEVTNHGVDAPMFGVLQCLKDRSMFASRLTMSGQTEGTIAALMRHSTRALVRRDAHLSPSYLHAAVETVAAYGKTSPKSEPISDGTVTETGNDLGDRHKKEAEVIEKVGAGDGI